VDTQYYYDTGYGAGAASVDTQSYYETGYGAGTASVDTQSYYDTGYGACFAADGAGDADLDGIVDGSDNCLFVANPVQTDSDHDGYGNICDADINNDGAVGLDDAGLVLDVVNTNSNPAADLNGDGGVGLDDVGLALDRANTLPGPSGYSCAGTVPCGPGFGAQRFVACSDGLTVEDTATGLLWERKTTDGSVHDGDNTYAWSASGSAPDGLAYTVFLADLNNPPGFAGHEDWRFGSISEVQSILIGPGVAMSSSDTAPLDPAMGMNSTGQSTSCSGDPCIDPAFAAISDHAASDPAVIFWAETSSASSPEFAWSSAQTSGGNISYQLKTTPYYVRAVRAGSCAP